MLKVITDMGMAQGIAERARSTDSLLGVALDSHKLLKCIACYVSPAWPNPTAAALCRAITAVMAA